MPKQKTKKAAAKRISITGTGKLKRRNAFRSHNLEKKSTRRKRNYVKSHDLSKSDVKRVKKLLGAS